MNNPTVLMVDDEPAIRAVALDALEDAGWSALETADGEAALEMIAGQPTLRVVVADIHMPGLIDGLALVRELKERRPDLALIVTSGAVATGRRLSPGDAVFLPKPFTADALVHAVRAAAARVGGEQASV